MIDPKSSKTNLETMSREQLIDELRHVEWHIAMTLDGSITFEQLAEWFMSRKPIIKVDLKKDKA